MIPKNRPTHPGKFVEQDILKELGLTQTQLANALGVPRQTLSQLVNEQSDLSADMALRLSLFTQTTPEMWLNLQLAIELWDAYHSPYAEQIEQIQPYTTMCLA
jgi:addiction module HigA family antidote